MESMSVSAPTSPSPKLPSATTTLLGPTSVTHCFTTTSPAVSQFVYSNNALAAGSVRSSLGSSGYSDTQSSCPSLSPADHTTHPPPPAVTGSVVSSLSFNTGSQTHTAAVETVSVNGTNSCFAFFAACLWLFTVVVPMSCAIDRFARSTDGAALSKD